mmetsp:Transcript_30915/g.51192  ORF Transcript_30915/g.51192 Transcript_30915/m.51192 type:complete len:313 (+) Transcript_30915:35-973(+)|eukprot:CAMPEP_0119318944 /NCGR_PEP_ID=MMETSP1333-20130426/48056_1 /TAXON_ID=418940 /ORGANISM="Scyphosphaera apsteinii, Strain RCC1455" /LENGTH=312 /DNA_ID=CAMNT_0007325257 /DNA_START=35 /DNA_END=973 /DNA_ORIENTATION=+
MQTTALPLSPEGVAELIDQLKRSNGISTVTTALCRGCTGDELSGIKDEVQQLAAAAKSRSYFDVPFRDAFMARFPWLLSLMLVQSVSGFVLEGFEDLIKEHVILAQFLTMLVGGGGNSSGQTVAELVKALSKGDLKGSVDELPRVLLREASLGAMLAIGLGLGAFPRVRILSHGATNLDAVAIAVSYMLIVVMANTIGVCTVMALNRCGLAPVGAPPVVQVLVDVLGITLTCYVVSFLLGADPLNAKILTPPLPLTLLPPSPPLPSWKLLSVIDTGHTAMKVILIVLSLAAGAAVLIVWWQKRRKPQRLEQL